MALLLTTDGLAQTAETDSWKHEIALVSDTQQPLAIERIFRRGEKNTLATKKILEDIIDRIPRAVFMLGDVVSVGYKEKKWPVIDTFLAQSRSLGISVSAILGNHELFTSSTRGEAAFNKRFPDQVNTGYYKLVDSICFVMLNSNFGKLAAGQEQKQRDFYAATMQQMEADPGVKLIVVACHHSPYSNSKIVKSNPKVQEQFVPLFVSTSKAKLFVSGHSHAFEHFKIKGKDFLTIGGGGGAYQPMSTGKTRLETLSDKYHPRFHYILLKRKGDQVVIISRQLKTDFSGFTSEYEFTVH
ncbi:MAG: metallophosphoesterase [Sediminibacterium sp.]